ncbi:hypothetical protein D6D00_00604 [Aureobasidium pullulans]|nr:hypothetical protein D6D00_00604 [Aureobasidium pullulans]
MAIQRGRVVVDLMDDDDDDSSDQGSPHFPTLHASKAPSASSLEKTRFLKDLNNYLPIGTIALRTPDGTPCEWEEVDLVTLPRLDLSANDVDHIEKLLTRQRLRLFMSVPSKAVFRVYVLPLDVGQRFLPRINRGIDTDLFSLLQSIDTSTETWHARPPIQREPFEMFAAGESGSLYWLFNNVPSPNPSFENVTSHFHREALSELLDDQYQLPGLRSSLYPYQRNSAGQMLQRECEDKTELDPRLEQRIATDGTRYFYAPWEVSFLRSPRLYDSCRGGILAETMGLGKTVICIALILATRGYLPQTPAQYDRIPVRPKTASLVETAISAINRHSAPWRSYFEKLEELTGEHMGQCIALLSQNAPSYEIPAEPLRRNRGTTTPAPRTMTLAATTLVVVPRNLLSQWQSELEKHTTKGSLRTLVMDDNKVPLPPPGELAKFDLILFSRPRFECEDRDGADPIGRRMSRYPVSCSCPYIGATRTRDCVCVQPDDLYVSPLKALHFLRVIIDEGHGMAAENTRIATVANKLVEASHHWVVSGTPAKDLIGIEMDLVGPMSHYGSPAPVEPGGADSQNGSGPGPGPGTGSDSAIDDDELLRRDTLLSQRKTFITKDEKDGAVRSIGSLVSNFLRIRPWSAGDEERGADWVDHFFRHEMTRPRMRTFSGFSKCLRRTLESIVIRTQFADVQRDIELPPLTHKIIRLEPSFYDKLTVNAFVFVLNANAVTSERTDVDYIFHKKSGKERTQLLNNLRASAFYWTGFSTADMQAAIEQSEAYIKKQTKLCSRADEDLLKRCIGQAGIMVSSEVWSALTTSHEVGLFVKEWPAESAAFWSFDKANDSSTSFLLCGATQLVQAQDYVNRQSNLDPAEGLAGVGIRALSVLHPQPTVSASTPVLAKAGIPSSTFAANQNGEKRSTSANALRSHPSKPTISSPTSKKNSEASEAPDEEEDIQLPLDSVLRQTSIVGTTSAKLSYLLSRIEDFYREEKILVFYDNDNTAYYIAQALEVLHIDYLIYAKSLTPALKSEYVVRFNQKPEHRVLLMDIGQAAYGLNFSCASRVFFINPVNRPQIEAQALKRAHRIGQTREVHAETLILKGTIEERIFERARMMNRIEHKNAKELDDDQAIREIIQSAQPIPVSPEEAQGMGRVAFIHKPQQLFARPGWASWKKKAKENSKARDDKSSLSKKGGKRKADTPNDGSRSKKRSKKNPAAT